MNVAFLHPDLGLGGAERLVVDAATALQSAGHRVVMLTSRHDPARAFPATVDGTLTVRVHGRWIPFHVAQRLRAPSAIARMAHLARIATRTPDAYDVIVCDLVAHVLPLLRRRTRARLVYYCHFPDRLLAPAGGAGYRAYRALLDRLEARGLAVADRVLVNSAYTASRLRDAFPELAGLAPTVVFPGVDPSAGPLPDPDPVLLAVGRFDPSKNLGLAVDAFAALRERLPAAAWSPLRLVVAGAYDGRLREHRETLAALRARVAGHALGERVVFDRSPADDVLRERLCRSLCVIYTPEREHYGYVPVEAMAAGRPVVAVNTGGPTETIVDGTTGWLRPPTASAFAEAIARVVSDPPAARRMGEAGRAHVAEHFSRRAFGERLERILAEVVRPA